MRTIRLSAVLLGLLALGTPHVKAQSLDLPAQITAFATAKAQTDGNGQVAVADEETASPSYQSVNAEGTFSVTGQTMFAVSDGGLYVYAWYYAQEDAGYYFDHWVKLETGETFTDVPRLDSVLSSGTTSNFDGTGTPYFFPLEQTYKGAYQSVGTYKAVFKAVPVYSCTSGQLVYAAVGENKQWNVIFSTGHAASLNDFAAPAFTNATAGASFNVNWAGASFVDNVVTVPVSFTASAVGDYTADLTLSSKGGASFKAVVKVVVEAAAANDVLVKNGSKQLTLSLVDGLAQAVAGDTIQLLRDVTVGSEQTVAKNLTFDLNGRTFGGELKVDGGDLTVIDSKMVGSIRTNGNAVSVVSGTLTLKRGEINGDNHAVVLNGGTTFNLIDGKLTSSKCAIYNNGGSVHMVSGEINVSASGNVIGINKQASNGEMTIEGGKITVVSTGGQATGIYSKGTVTVHNAMVNASGATAVAMDVQSGKVALNQYAVLNATATGTGSAVALKSAGTVTVDGGRFRASNVDGGLPEIDGSGVTVTSGYFVVDQWVNSYKLASNQAVYNLGAGQAYRDGYRFYIGTSENAKDDAVSVCAIGETAYGTLEEALLYAQNNPSEVLTILMINNYTVPAGYYTLPANATLLVPRSADQKESTNGKVMRSLTTSPHAAYLTLTFASGARLDAYGRIEAGGVQYCGQVMDPGASATSTGSYGQIVLNSGSTVTLENNAVLYAWGFVTGDGEIHARRGSVVREFFQVYDWPGAGNAFNIYQAAGEKKLFPLNQYFIQNVEAATVYHPGSRLYASFAATGAGITAAADNIQLVGLTGENAMYLMDAAADAENTWVRKWYDVTNDKQVYDVNSGAHLGSMVISLPMLQALGMSSFDSKLFILPLTSNMKIHLLTGAMDITQSTEMLPGMEIEVDKEATVTVNPDVSLYMYDTDQWDKYARNAYAQVIGFTPSWGDQPKARDVSSLEAIGDAKLNVHGTFDIKGRLLTTTSGANIFSNNEDAGTVRFTTAAPASADDKLYQFKVGAGISEPIATIPALLRNSAGQDPAFAESASTPAGQAYCFVEDKWRMMTDADPFVYDNYGAWYVKPGAYVSVVTQPSTEQSVGTEPRINADHTYSDAAGAGRLFILVENQWWEVTLDNNLYRATNGKYYVFDDNDGAFDEPRWHEKQFMVFFNNWDGNPVLDGENNPTIYELTYGSMPFYNGTNPTRAEDVDFTYTFTGWMPQFAPVTEDAVYTATYQATQRKYTIIFLDENGKEIERHFLTRDEMPECRNTPAKTGYFLTWSPGIGAVVGDQTYQAVFTPEPPTEFTITFKNYDGSVLQTFDNVREGTLLAGLYTGTPSKPETTEYTYTFAGWQPAITSQTAATADMSYTAQFTPTRKKAAVTFEDENGNQIGEVQSVEVGQTPVAPDYTKEADAEYTYTVTWLPAVTAVVSAEPVTYSAEITAERNKYTVRVTTTNCTVIGAGTYEYGTEVTLSLIPAAGYESAKWSDNTTGDKTFTVTSDITFSASGVNGEEPDEPDEPEEPIDLVLHINDVYNVSPDDGALFGNLTIEADANGCGQLIGAEDAEMAENGHAYYRYIFRAAAQTWYDFAVPFECNGATVLAGGKTLQLGKDYYIISFNSEERAKISDTEHPEKKEASAWNFLSQQSDKTLVPGRLYMIYFNAAQTDVTFTMKAGADLVYSTPVTVSLYDNGGMAEPTARNWNAIANPALYTAQLTVGTVTHGQFYKPETESYEARELVNEMFYVGKPVFVQVDAASAVSVQAFPMNAPVRRAAADNDECVLTISDEANVTDRVYLFSSEDASDEYVIGQDLAKVAVSGKVAQMWVNRYNCKLCVNTVAADENDAVEYPLGIFAPQAGAYTVNAIQSETGTQVLLICNGVAVADLTRGSFALDLARGTTTAYAIRIIGRRGTPTAIDEAVSGQSGARKVISNGILYIMRDGRIFDAQGNEVK
ncbi:MAG: hypothetical protein J6Y00_01605 [Paludibacteraceae bacterium]|nr:hypothetical protein [Paludibacteraceae bacterium]